MATFKYFAYGSNLLKERILIMNPTARYCYVGKLEDYAFGYDLPESSPRPESKENRWNGSTATINPQAGSHVYGVVWDINIDQMANLDRQESGYKPIDVSVTKENGSVDLCRTYVMLSPRIGLHKPGPYYKRVILYGARQHKLPENYIDFLEKFPDTGMGEAPETFLLIEKMMKENNSHSVS